MSRNFDGGERLEENKDYRVYRYGDDLKPGYELKVEHSVSCENVDISALIAMGTESLRFGRDKAMGTAGGGDTDHQPGAGISADPGGCSYIESVAIKG